MFLAVPMVQACQLMSGIPAERHPIENILATFQSVFASLKEYSNAEPLKQGQERIYHVAAYEFCSRSPLLLCVCIGCLVVILGTFTVF